MKPGINTTIYETPLTSLWFDEDGFLCSLTKKGERSIENYHQLIEVYKSLAKNGNKLCVISDSTNAVEMSKDVISLISTEFPKYMHALAIISTAPLVNSHINTFLKLTFADFPVMMFATEDEAKKWLKEFL